MKTRMICISGSVYFTGPIPLIFRYNENEEAKASPFSLVSRRGIEPLSTDSESGTLSFELTGHISGAAFRQRHA